LSSLKITVVHQQRTASSLGPRDQQANRIAHEIRDRICDVALDPMIAEQEFDRLMAALNKARCASSASLITLSS
jgi:hypothetical protein